MINKKDQNDPIDNLEYEKVLEEEIINSYESKFQKDTEEDTKKILIFGIQILLDYPCIHFLFFE